jgi:hypothetical protein
MGNLLYESFIGLQVAGYELRIAGCGFDRLGHRVEEMNLEFRIQNRNKQTPNRLSQLNL